MMLGALHLLLCLPRESVALWGHNSHALALEMKPSAICTGACGGMEVMALACAGILGTSSCSLCFECF